MASRAVAAVVEKHRSSGRTFTADGIPSFVLDQGDGAAVVCLHGVPASSFLYRKVVPALAAAGLRGVAFDFPGLGLADRPDDFDYTWSGLARWTAEALDALGIDRCHLLLHDIGGPIGFEFAIKHPDRVLSMSVLNSPADVGTFRRPWPMHPFSIAGVGEAWLAAMRPPAARWLFRHVGLDDNASMSNAEVDTYFTLMRRQDGGRAFLKIMRGFELTRAKEDYFRRGLSARSYPAQVVWGGRDAMLDKQRMAAVVAMLKPEVPPQVLPGRHFYPEDHSIAIASAVAALACTAD